MWGDNNSTNYGFGNFNRPYITCHTATVPCPCCYNNIANPNSLLNYQIAPEQSTIYGYSHASNLVSPSLHVENDHEASDRMGTNEIEAWLMSNTDNDQIDGSMNRRSYGSYNVNQYHGQFIQMQPQGIQPSLLPMVAGFVPEATIGTMDLQQEWAPNHLSFSQFYAGNPIKESVGTYANTTSISSIGAQQLVSQDDLQKSSDQYPLMTRQDRILRYFEKKKARKYEKKVASSSKKTYAQTRPRIRGRFASSSQMDANDKSTV